MSEKDTHDQLEEGEEVEEVEEATAADQESDASEETTKSDGHTSKDTANSEEAPPLPEEEAPPLPDEELPDDGWAPVWDENAQAFYFYNRFTHATQWDNPRVPEASSVPASSSAAGLGSHDRIASSTTGPPGTSSPIKRVAGGYNPAIHGDYDENADYAIEARIEDDDEPTAAQLADPNSVYAAQGAFNRFTGKWQAATLTPDNFNDEHKSKRQMNAFFDVDAAANSHDGRSLKAERQGKKLSKDEVKAFKEKRRAKKEEKRRAWLRD
jgi:hypothetical protein